MPEDLTRSHNLIVLDGTTFVLSRPDGELAGGDSSGYFHEDVRHLSDWRLSVDGAPLVGVTAAAVDYYSARVVLAPSTSGSGLVVRRDRFVSEGVHEHIVVANLEQNVRRLELELRFAADFADVLEARDGGAYDEQGSYSTEVDDRSVTLWFERAGFRRGTRLEFGADCELNDERARFHIVLEPHEEWRLDVDIIALGNDFEARPLLRSDSFGAPEPEMPLTLPEWLDAAPVLETPNEDLTQTYEQSLRDLAALRIRPRRDLQHAMPAGGIPWFMCVFGRDSILAAYEALPFEPTLAEATLQALADLQAHDRDDWRDAEPGKIPHELRRGKLAHLREDPRDPYYGSHDSTQLWLILLDEYERWTGDAELVRRLEPNARRALEWLDNDADLDGDGYAEYERRSPKGLRNHCWKDSDDSIVYADGRRADPPIATCEIQGYTYDARLRAARLARELWNDNELAERQEQEAAALKQRFNRDFWNDQRGSYLLALAGRGANKQRVDAISSNPGQLLWSGIVDREHADTLARRLLAPDLFSGWGIRSLADTEIAFNPLQYHTGTVWPHDSALIVAGLRRYGFDREATRLCRAILDAAAAFGHRLPELFAGFTRDDTNLPIRYPDALVPQAWAAAAPLLILRTLLGLSVEDGRLCTNPVDDPLSHGLRLHDVQFRGQRVDLP